MSDTIFIGISSYRDPLLTHTIKSALDHAKYPENLRFGIVEQEILEHRIKPKDFFGADITYISIDPAASRGACWARSIQMSLYNDEDWILQCDSHTIFGDNWDEYFVEMSKILRMGNKKCLISSYPRGFTFKNGKSTPVIDDEKVIGHVCIKESCFEANGPVVTVHPVGVDSLIPVRGFYIGAGCIFAPGKFVYDVPYDPYLYFNGEEISLAVRAFTHGWDVYHAPAMPIYHLFESGDGDSYRKKHWSEDEDEDRKLKWGELDVRAKTRLSAMLLRGEDVGRFGLGNARTLEQFAEFSGIDYKNKIIHEKARKGVWAKDF